MRMDASEQQIDSSSERADKNTLVSIDDLRQASLKNAVAIKPVSFIDYGNVNDLYKSSDDPLAGLGASGLQSPRNDVRTSAVRQQEQGGFNHHPFLFGGNAHVTLDSLQSAIGGKANLEMFPVKPGNEQQMNHVRDDLAKGVTPEVSLNGEFFAGGDKAIASGRYDQQLTQMAHELSQMRGQDGNQADILMRFGKEMDLQHQFVGSGQDFVDAFQHVHDVFHAAGADNVSMVWCPTKKVDPTGLTDQANPDKYWPGSNYVDVIGPDGYSSKGKEESFQKLFEPFVDLAKRTGKPFMTSEAGLHTDGMTEKQKSDWWQNAFNYVQDERSQGTDILGVGGFFRYADKNETLSDQQRRVLADTFIKAEGTAGGDHPPVNHPPIDPPVDKPPCHHPPIDHPGGDNPGGHPHCPPDHPHPPGHEQPPQPPGGDPTPPVGGGTDHDILFGGFTNGNWRGNAARDALDQEIGGRADLEQFYRPMGGSISDLRDYIQGDLNRGITPEVSLNPKANDFNYADIASGHHDQYFHDLAQQLGSMKDAQGNPAEILLRPGWEFNLRHMQSMGTSEEYVRAYQHMHDIFQQEGASNVKFVWSPGQKLDMSGIGTQPDLQHYWPGAQYVDVVGPDGYSTPDNHFKSFDELFKPAMDLAQRTGTSFMVSETGIDREGQTAQQTADWWRSAFQTLQQRQADGLDVTGVAAFMKAGDFGWGYRDFTVDQGEQDAIRDTFLR
ncbi:hypothetical protein BH10CYA1_BH10CYA1_12930 [soil metagenome]